MADGEKTCGYCGKPMTGRSDKRFCSDQCRATSANVRRLTEEGELLIRNVNRVLRRNRQILRQASPVGKTTVRRQVLSLAGFNFNYFTHIYRTRQGNNYYFCYDYGYLLLPQEDKVLIVNWQQYMEPKESIS
jgi:predicted nucleic acid-binding Zn ribbon protein